MNILKINGTALTGIYVDAAVSFNKPAKRVETFSVPGRNGDLVIDEGTFDNVLISYPVYEKSTFPDEFDAIVNWLASLQGYQRIECSNDPQHYRLGRFVVPQTPTAKRLNKDGYYTLTFDCKPQRWLLSGEEDTEITANPATTYTGDVASFTGGPFDEITGASAKVTPIQTGTGDPSPSNIRPISGWKGLTLYNRTGKNIFDGASARWKYDYLLDSTGAESSNNSYKYTENYTLVEPSTTYAVQMYKSTTTSSALSVCQYDANKNFVKRTVAITATSGTGVKSGTFTTDANVRYIRFSAPRNSDSAKGSRDFMIEVGSTASTYEAFAGGVYPFTWETEVGAIFGGTLNVLTGELAIETGYAESTADGTMTDYLPDGTITANKAWTFNSPYAYCSIGNATFVPVASIDSLEAMCNQFVEVQRATATTSEDNSFAIRVTSSVRRFTFRQTSIPDWDVGSTSAEKAEKVKAYWAAQYALGNILQVVYKLATPYVIQLTAAEVEDVIGQNNFWSETGTSSITVLGATVFNNPSPFNAKPLIRVYGIGTFRINDNVVTIASHDKPYIDIDCELQECYYEGENMSAYVSFSDNDYPVLVPDDNYVLMVGVTKLDVTPRWWIL